MRVTADNGSAGVRPSVKSPTLVGKPIEVSSQAHVSPLSAVTVAGFLILGGQRSKKESSKEDMAKTRQRKESEVREFVDGLRGAKSTVFADLSSLKVNETSSFRRTAKKEDVSVAVAKKTLLRHALKEANVTAVDIANLQGSVAMLFGMGDEIAPAKLLAALRKEKDTVKVLGGLLEGQWMTADQVMALAKLPSKQQLIGQLVGVMNSPISGFVNVLAGNLRGLVTVLGAIKDTKTA